MKIKDYFTQKELDCLKDCQGCEIADSCDIKAGMDEFLEDLDSE